MDEQIVSRVYYKLHLLVNLENSPVGGGTLLIDIYEFDPNLAVGDTVYIEDWKVAVSTDTDTNNESFSFSAAVISIQKTVVRHSSFMVNIILESPDRETVAKMQKTLRERNPDKFFS